MSRIRKLSDRISSKDIVSTNESPFAPAVLARTKILGGYDHFIDKNGISQLGEVIFEGENQIVLGGAMFILEKLFGIKAGLQMDSLNTIMNIATEGGAPAAKYPDGRMVALFGVGVGGAGDSITSVKESKFYEREIQDMVPVRVVDGAIQGAEKEKYFFKKPLTGGKNAYYLKKFAADPTLKVLWKDGEADEDGSPVVSSPHDGAKQTPIETFVELVLQIDKKDIREWFTMNGNVEQTRINSIGLFTGILSDTSGGQKDYKDVRMFSKLNINNEMLQNLKTLTFIYRIYTS